MRGGADMVASASLLTGGGRVIHRSGDEDFLQRLLETICIAEIIRPSRELWLFSAWITDFRILDNSRGTLDGLLPDWGHGEVRLTGWLRHLAESGTTVRVKTNMDEKNVPLVRKIEAISALLPSGRLQVRRDQNLHAKGLIGNEYYLRGSFNFTANGILTLEEQGQFDVDPAVVSQGRVNMADRWEKEDLP
jgi:hypothetical protein